MYFRCVYLFVFNISNIAIILTTNAVLMVVICVCVWGGGWNIFISTALEIEIAFNSRNWYQEVQVVMTYQLKWNEAHTTTLYCWFTCRCTCFSQSYWTLQSRLYFHQPLMTSNRLVQKIVKVAREIKYLVNFTASKKRFFLNFEHQ